MVCAFVNEKNWPDSVAVVRFEKVDVFRPFVGDTVFRAGAVSKIVEEFVGSFDGDIVRRSRVKCGVRLPVRIEPLMESDVRDFVFE